MENFQKGFLFLSTKTVFFINLHVVMENFQKVLSKIGLIFVIMENFTKKF